MTPFVIAEIREKIRQLGFGEADAVGDLCYIAYREMMDRWNTSPRWTTIHYIRKEFVTQPKESAFLKQVQTELVSKAKIEFAGFVRSDGQPYKFDWADLETAAALAFDVFMHFHGIEYEKKKREENGDIF